MLKRTLKTRLIFSVLLIIFLFGLASAIMVFVYARNVLIENKKASLFSLITEEARGINQIFSQTENLAETIANKPELKAYFKGEKVLQEPNILKLLENYLIKDQYLAIYILDKNGTGLVSTDSRFVGQNYNFRNYFKKTILGEVVVEANVGVTSKELGFYFSFPVYSDSQVVGILVVKLNPQNIVDPILRNLPDYERIMFVNANGVIIYCNDTERQFKSLGILSEQSRKDIEQSRKFPDITVEPLSYEAVQKDIEAGKKQGVVDFFDIKDSEEEIVSYFRLDGQPFYLVVEQSKDKFTAQALFVAFWIVVFLFLGLLISSLVIVLLVSSTFQPINQLKGVAKYISLGDFRQKVNIKTQDELEELGDAINTMIDSLQDSYSNLEKKVSDKTKELAEQLQNISEKNKVLANTQRALVNVMDDIQEEKTISQNLAKDLLKFQLAVEKASDHIIITDPDGKILFANKAAEKITGYGLEDMKGQRPSLWGKQMSAEFYKKFWQTIKNDKKSFSGEITNKRKNGEKYIAEIYVSPILKENGEVQFFVGVERDITKAKEVDKSKTEFVSLASHQLRTPLTAISWYIEMLLGGKAGNLTANQKKYLEEVYRGSLRMRDLVNSLLNVSRLEMGTFIVEPEMTDIKVIAENLLKEMKSIIFNKKLKVNKNFKNLPKKFFVDPKLFGIILQNLLSNAVKYTPKGGVVSLDIEGREKEMLIIVEDSGYGIPKIQQDKIFTKFFRADNARIKDPDGTGLGLYMIKTILGHTGGKIWFESEENKGSKFFVSLPLTGMPKKIGDKSLV